MGLFRVCAIVLLVLLGTSLETIIPEFPEGTGFCKSISGLRNQELKSLEGEETSINPLAPGCEGTHSSGHDWEGTCDCHPELGMDLATSSSSLRELSKLSEEENKITTPIPEIDNCAICMEKIIKPDDANVIYEWTGCKHEYHMSCIQPLLVPGGRCPKCRGKLSVTLSARILHVGFSIINFMKLLWSQFDLNSEFGCLLCTFAFSFMSFILLDFLGKIVPFLA
ncbi:hypothetical protein PGT21_014228 [Puccinia graminis f. sp. tritici]|uniref:RING-type domain-containing protein n=1 Tax=Puccinia graminis f. sp. tritici TaxID=56615 RepID=A0A5B0QMS3_PUCGR|nr:hypothetical protein PGT21_014228 [Puccinia graminis f. sp. tritici]